MPYRMSQVNDPGEPGFAKVCGPIGKVTGGAPPAGTGGAAPGHAPKGDPEPTTVGPVWTWPLGGTGEDGAHPGVEPDEPEPAPPVISAQ